VLVKCWSNAGQTLVKCWSNAGQMLVKRWSNAGQMLSSNTVKWAKISDREMRCAEAGFWTGTDPALAWGWSNTGQILVKYWSNASDNAFHAGQTPTKL
jgi:hypothetical protein